MKTHSAKFIDACHYRISDHAAAALCKLADKPLPRPGYEMSVFLTKDVTGPSFANAWMNRTCYGLRPDAPKRGWVWCVHSVSHPETREGLSLGKSFSFVA